MSDGTCGYHKGKAVPSAIYVRDEDELRVGVQTALSGLIIGVSGMMMNAQGETSKFTVTVIPTSDRVETVVSNNIGSGWILHAQAHVISGTVTPRSVYVSARIVSNTGTPAIPMTTVLAGYLDNVTLPAFPYVLPEHSLNGNGRVRSIAGTNPAVNVEITETVPTGAQWRLLGFIAQLVTDANVANRQVTLILDDGTTTLWSSLANATQAASLTRNYNYYPWYTLPAAAGTEIFGYIPPNLLLPAGFRIRTSTASLQVTDNWGAPQLLVEEWLIQ